MSAVSLNQVLLADRLDNTENYAKRVGGTVTRQAGIVEGLAPLEELVRKHAPLAASYDVGRTQPMYFSEFTYTELLGNALFVCPQNSEMATKIVHAAARTPLVGMSAADVAKTILNQSAFQDKYIDLQAGNVSPIAVAVLPGSNSLWKMVDENALRRALHEDPELMLKPHPVTTVEDIRKLKIIAGLHRLLEPSWSGFALTMNATRVYSTATSELAIYAYLHGKPVYNIGAFNNEYVGAYYPLFSLATTTPVRNQDPALLAALSNPLSGVFFKNDPNLEENIKRYFANAMNMRELYRPCASEMSALNK